MRSIRRRERARVVRSASPALAVLLRRDKRARSKRGFLLTPGPGLLKTSFSVRRVSRSESIRILSPLVRGIPLGSQFGVRVANVPRGFVSTTTTTTTTTTMPRRIVRGRPVGVGTDYLTDKQLYERVGQRTSFISDENLRISPRINLGWGAGGSVLGRITRRMEEGRSRLLHAWRFLPRRGTIAADTRRRYSGPCDLAIRAARCFGRADGNARTRGSRSASAAWRERRC